MGKGKPVELETAWGDQKSETFKVTAAKLREVGEFLNKREEWGRFEGGIPWGYDTEGAFVTKVTLKPWYFLEMPEWDGYSKAPKACQTAWDNVWKKLQEHEEGHKEVFMDILAKAQKYVKNASDLSAKQVKKDLDKLIGGIQAAQKKFDTATDHGKKKGVYLDIPEECE
jgi:predicted secreted Zn-dependent protease